MILIQPTFTGQIETSKTPIFVDAEIIGKDRKRYFLPTGSSNNASRISAYAPTVFDEFERQKSAFLSIPPLLLVPFEGKYVASINGTIVDSDDRLADLANRFVSRYGDAEAYITRINAETDPIVVRTPFME